MGGTETDPGIFINWTLRLGTTASRCITFNKFWPISRDLVFDIRILELWVVNEVIMKKRNSPKRDFYSTVVMWNRIGKHNAKGDPRRSDSRECDGPNTFTNDNQVIHETNGRHFQPSATSLVGPHNTEGDLILFAIKNRLARVPPMSALEGGAGLQPVKQELTVMSAKPRYNVDIQADKAKRSPSQVSTQITNCTIPPSEMRKGEHLHLPQQHIEFCRPPSKNLLPDELCCHSIQPRRNLFPNQTKRCSASSVPRANCAEPQMFRNTEVISNSIQNDRNSLSLPRVPDYKGASSRRPSGASRNIRSGTEEVPHNHQIHELSWPDKRGMGGARQHQQLLLQRGQDRSDPNALKQSSIRSGTPPRNLNQPSITVSDLLSRRESERPSHQSNRLPLYLRVKTEPDPESPFESPPIDPPKRTNDQLCRCGSKDRNLICSCKKSILKEVEVPSVFRACNCRNENRKRREKKEKKRSPGKESKAEERRRKKEEKEYKRKLKKEQKEKQRKNSKPKRTRMSKKGEKSDKGCKRCKCCGCYGEEVTVVFSPESNQLKQKSRREKSPKKEKQPKINKCRRTTNEDSRPVRSCKCPRNGPIRSIKTEECPPYDTERPPYTQFSYPSGQVRYEEQVLHEKPSPLGYCSHPDIPCPAVGSRAEYRKSATYDEINRTDPVCTNVRPCEDENNGSPVRSCCCRQQTQPCRAVVCAYPVIVDQRPNIVQASSTEQTGNSRSTHLKAKHYSLPISGNLEAMGYRDVTAAPALCSYEIGHGDTVKLGQTPNQGSSYLPHEFSTNNLLTDTSKKGHNNGTNKRYVPPCVLYLDCTKVKDLCVIIKDKYEEDPS